MNESSSPHPQFEDDSIDFAELFRRIRRGAPLTLGLGLLGLAIAATAYIGTAPFQTLTTTTRVVFSFSGFEKGEYPDKSKFTPDDLRSPEIVGGALKRKGLDTTQELQSQVRAALSIEGIIPDSVIKDRDKQRTAGQTPRFYVADEYSITLSLPRSFPLSVSQRESLLSEIVSIYQEKFTQTYNTLPLGIGKVFEALEGADYNDYDLIMLRDSENLTFFIQQMGKNAPTFRSRRTNFSFGDLYRQSLTFTQIRLNELLGLIRRYGLSKDRSMSVMKMDYFLKNLKDQEKKALEDEKVVQALLQQTKERENSYTLGVKSQTGQQRTDPLVVDQGLVDSLLANDAYNFLIRRSLEVSLDTRRIQSEIAVLQERRDHMEEFLKADPASKLSNMADFQRALDDTKRTYENLITSIRLTYEDWNGQQFNDAVRISMQSKTNSFYRSLAMAGIAGLGIGMATGLGLSLLGASTVAGKPKP